MRVGLVGCGAVSAQYYTPALQALQQSGMLQVVALFDPNPERAATLNRSFPRAARLDRFARLADTGAELAIIASPPRYHAEQTIGALEAGLAVLCEKPMALTVAEGRAMIAAAEAASRVLAVGLLRRFFPATRTIRDALSRGLIGDVVSFSFCEGNDFHWPVASPDFFRKDIAYGGVLLDIGVHALDLLLWWWGQPDEIRYQDDAMGGVEVNCRLQLRFSRGLRGEIRLSREWPLLNEYVIRGTKGWIRWEVNEADRVQIGLAGSRYILDAALYEGDEKQPALLRPAENFHRSFIAQLRNVVAAVRGHEPLCVSGEEGLRSVALIEHCYRHRTCMSMPWLSESEYRRARTLNAS
ncbi:MAG: Gfo/Idh/MocA family oxidoreductase [Candidatus Binatia bacterium]|nr:Gfo/Idh/MocA family oxidoreductase [Candidatus Binatia bacterium]